MQKVIYLSELDLYIKELEKPVVSYIKEGQIETYESFDTYTIAAFDWYNLFDENAKPDQILIYIDRNDIFFICENADAYKAANSYFEEGMTNDLVLYSFLKNTMKGGMRIMEKMETEVYSLEDEVNNGSKEGLSEQIFAMRDRIRHVNRYYEQIEFLIQEFCENDNYMISEKEIRNFENLKNRAIHFNTMAAHLRDYIMQVREAYKAQIGIEQNNLMRVFTMVTSIFMPLTLIVGWYGMNVKMPETTWEYGYIFVAVLCVVVCGIWMYVFRRKKWL